MILLDHMFILVSEPPRQAVLRLNGAHPIFAVHFPGRPITPGVCLVQLLGELLQRQTGRTLKLSSVVNLKFVHTLSPDTDTLITVDFTTIDITEESVHAKGTIAARGQIATKFSVVYHCATS